GGDRGSQDLLACRAVVGEQSSCDAGLDPEPHVVDHKRSSERLLQPRGEGGDLVSTSDPHQDPELVFAEARNRLSFLGSGGKTSGDLAEELVAAVGAKHAVDEPELDQIDEEHDSDS